MRQQKVEPVKDPSLRSMEECGCRRQACEHDVGQSKARHTTEGVDLVAGFVEQFVIEHELMLQIGAIGCLWFCGSFRFLCGCFPFRQPHTYPRRQ